MLDADDRLAILDVIARYHRFADERDVEAPASADITDELRKVDGASRVARHHVAIDPAMGNAIARDQGATAP